MLITNITKSAFVIVPALLIGLLFTATADAAPPIQSSLPGRILPIERVQNTAADLNGVWSDGIAPIQIHQNGPNVAFRYVTNDYDHTFRGHFVLPYEVEGKYTPRRNRTTGCATTMAVHIDVRDANTFILHWRALDSNCDLAAGQMGTDVPYVRQYRASSQEGINTPYVRQYRPSWQAAPGDTSCCPNNMLVCPLGRHFCGH